ncbi:hypothetical protein MBAV_005905 [Candidatus Magnetobacterium bavaricum]|uniref:Secreted protein n=1 Tax=Candidatus Magnetobacterium bavaricum TaxID=29290 RepID=A0A0F3GMK7_9BACT|nr:hypothetical protein MBAV_005905 [Candidatus Magnetobacterium bavaricum]
MYCLFKKALAPSLIASEIALIASVPVPLLKTHLASANAATPPTTLNPRTRASNTFSSIASFSFSKPLCY